MTSARLIAILALAILALAVVAGDAAAAGKMY